MSTHTTLEGAIASAVRMIKAGLATLDQAVSSSPVPVPALQQPLGGSDSAAPSRSRELVGSTRMPTAAPNRPPAKMQKRTGDHFVFYQVRRWRWERISEAGEVTASSEGEYPSYVDCVSNATRNGWDGKPSAFVAQIDQMVP